MIFKGLLDILFEEKTNTGPSSSASSSAGAEKKPQRGLDIDAASADEDETAYVGFDTPEFRASLKSLFQTNHQLTVGGMHLIGLSHIRDHFKEDWAKKSEFVHDIAVSSINRHLGPQDIFTCYEEIVFVVVFGGIPESQASLKCAMIADEIALRIFGEKAKPDLVEVATTTLDENGNLSMDMTNLPSFLKNMMGGGTDNVHRHPVASPSMPKDKLQPSPSPQETTEAEKPPIETSTRRGKTSKELELEKQKEVEALLATLPPREQKLYSFGVLSFVYRPIWLVKDRVTSASTCVPSRVTSEGTLRVGGPALLSSPDSPVNAEYDLACLESAGEELGRLAKLKDTAIIILPVHYMTLIANKYRVPYLNALNKLPEALKKQIRFELISIPRDVPAGRIGDALSTLRVIGNDPLVRVRLDFQHFEKFVGLGVYAIGFDVLNFNASEEALIEEMRRFSSGAAKHGFRTYAHGLQTKSLISAAVCEGYHYLDGDPVCTTTGSTQGNTPFDLDSLYSPSSKGAGDA